MSADITSSAEGAELTFSGRWRVWLRDTGCWCAARSERPNAAGLTECVQDQEDLQPKETTR
jgi:hypothetical protein